MDELEVHTYDKDIGIVLEWKRKGILIISTKQGNYLKNRKLCMNILEAYINTLEEE